MRKLHDKPFLGGGAPRAAGFFSGLLRLCDRFFDWAYHSSSNPLYRSGTLATGLLLVATATGVYLLFFYKVSAPYESMRVIQDQWFLGRWMRALHR